jgi:hypothetical protein
MENLLHRIAVALFLTDLPVARRNPKMLSKYKLADESSTKLLLLAQQVSCQQAEDTFLLLHLCF